MILPLFLGFIDIRECANKMIGISDPQDCRPKSKLYIGTKYSILE